MTTPRASAEGVRRKPSYFSDVRKCQKSLKGRRKKARQRPTREREMKTFQSQSQPAQRGAPSNLHSLSGSAMSPLSPASITLTALLILTTPACTAKGAPADIQQATTDPRQLLRQIDSVCSSYPSADLKFWTSDVLGELCVLMLVQKSKVLGVQEKSKRIPESHPLLHLVSQLHTRRERGLSMRAELQGPGGIESRGYFLYRPRNGRRSLEYE